MKITVIYETMKKNTTYHCVKLFLNRLKSNINIEIEEFILNENLSEIYNDCFLSPKYINKKNLHYNDDNNLIIKSLQTSDLIIFASSLYSYDSNLEFESLVNDISYNSNSSYNSLTTNKIGLIISSNKVKLHSANRNIKNFLKFFGVKKILKFNGDISSISSDDIEWNKKQKINNKISVIANKILNNINKIDKSTYLSHIKAIFSPVKSIKQNTDWNVIYLNCSKKHTLIN